MNIGTSSVVSLEKKIAFSTLVQYGGKIVQLVLGIINLRLIARFLSMHEYGVYAAITEYALFFSVAANLGLFAYLVRRISDQPKDGQVFFNALILRVVTALVFFVIAIVSALFVQNEPLFLIGTVLFLSALLADFVTTICDAFLQANYLMGRATFALLLGKIVYSGALLFLLTNQPVIETASVLMVLGVTILSSLVTMWLSLFYVRQKIKWQWQIVWAELWTILKVSLPFGIINIVNALYFRFLPDYFAYILLDKASFSAFSIAFKIAQVASLFSTFLMFSVLPGFRKYIDDQHWQKARKLYRDITRILSGLALFVFIFGSLGATTLISFLADKKYIIEQYWFMFPAMLLLAAISYGYDLVLITLFALGQERWFLKRELIALAIALVILLLATQLTDNIWQLGAIIVAAISAETVIVVLGYQKAHRLLHDKELNHSF
ncbi:MAG: oligosaccharide flippase family protein [Candidatus Abawacabacteria bacterium]|nr:oligosaccharide flippase family protein [Candidatus Abawacabacteria bacterium]